MRGAGARGGLVALAVALLALSALRPASAELDEAERRGQQIYREGTSPRGHEIEALVGESRTPLPGRAALRRRRMRCAMTPRDPLPDKAVSCCVAKSV